MHKLFRRLFLFCQTFTKVGKHTSKDELIKNYENLLATINALEVSLKDDCQRGVIKVLRALTDGQIHSINEFNHLKNNLPVNTTIV